MESQIAAALAENAEALKEIDTHAVSIDAMWTLLGGFLVVFMHAGFAMLETGSVRAPSKTTVLIKNLINVCISAGAWWMFGYGLAFGDDKGGFLGGSLFFGINEDYKMTDESFHYLYWFFQWAFCATGATIVSGATAERCKLSGFGIYAFVMCAFIYPIIVHWTWGGGWLTEEGYIDFAGSGIVHLTGGISALFGAAVLGPRTGRFEKERQAEFEAHNVAIVILGTLILWFGWYGFNCGSTVAMSGSAAESASIVAMNTSIAAAAGGLVAFGVQCIVTKAADVCALANGILAGLVSITAGCDGVYTWGALFIGLFGGLLFLAASNFMKYLKIDDPVDAFAVHGACGIWGVMAVAFFNSSAGVFAGGDTKIIGVQLLGVVAIVVWSGGLSLALFLALRAADLLRKPDPETRQPEAPPKEV